MTSNWTIDDHKLVVTSHSGDRILPSAQEIFSIAFGSATAIRGVPCPNPKETLSFLRFSKFPAEPAVRLYSQDSRMLVQTGVLIESEFIQVGNDVDQIVWDDTWYPIHAASVTGARMWLADLGVNEGQSLTVGSLIALRARADRPVRLVDEVSITSETLVRYPPGTNCIEGIEATLYPYQSIGVAYLKEIAEQGVGCILADEMGLGKTLQIIALLQCEKLALRIPNLVVVPATLLENWRRELRRFAPHLTVHTHAGSDRPGIWHGIEEFDVSLVSYDLAIRDEVLLSAISWNLVVLDEAQNIKNPNAQRTRAVKRLPRRSSIAVTGTPIENRVEDLWSLADFALPGLLGALPDFQREFSGGIADAERLATITAPMVLRRYVADVADDLPERIEIPQAVAMNQSLAESYEALRQSTLNEYGASANLVSLTRLRMFCAHPSLCDSWQGDPAEGMAKYQRLLEILSEIFASNEKVLVFSTYTGMADLFMRDITSRFPGGHFQYIDGRVDVGHRQPIIDGFYSYKGFGALFLNPKAAGAGLNITAANHVVHYNPEWNPAVTAQASARAFRRGQQKPVTIHHLFFAATVEEVIVERARQKSQLASTAVSGHEGEASTAEIARAMQISPVKSVVGPLL